MSRFIVIHGVPVEATQQELIAGAKTVAASLPAGTEWLNSWAAGPSGRMFCEWEAPDAEAIRAALEPVKHLFPVEALHQVEWIDPAWYRPETE
ncbi:MAG: DUF4242 domain-containing protein [Anaerolineae bacterium]